MPRDGQGGYVPPLNNWNPALDGNEADPASWNQLLADLISALSQSVSSDGQTMMTGNLKMGGNTLQGMGAPSANGQALRRDQVTKGPNIESASTITIPAEGSVFEVTGTTTINQMSGSYDGRMVVLVFQDELIIKHGPNLQLPSATDITTRAGDAFVFYRKSSSEWAALYGDAALTKLGNAATRDVGKVSGTVAAGDDSRITGLKSAAYLDTLANGGSILQRGSYGVGRPTTNTPVLQNFYAGNYFSTTHNLLIMNTADGYSTTGRGIGLSTVGGEGGVHNLRIDQGTGSVTTHGQFYGQWNTTVDTNGFVKSASPIVRLFNDRVEFNDHPDAESVEFIRIETGHYELDNTTGFAQDGWYIETPKDANGNIKVFVEYEDRDGDITVRTYEPDYSSGWAQAGPPVDIPEGRWIDIRLNETEQPLSESPLTDGDQPDPTEPEPIEPAA